MHSSDSSDEAHVIDSDLLRGRNKDISPHNRHARPRSSCIKKEINKEKDVSEQSTPKRVRFHEEVKDKIQPVNLKTRLENQQFDNNANYEDNRNQYAKEISRDEFESKFNQRQDDYNPNTAFGRRLRSQERVQANDSYSDNRNPPNNFNYNDQRISPTQKLAENRIVMTGRQTPPRSFQLKNVVNNTEYVRKRLPDGTNEKNTTIHEMSSRFEESRDENNYRRPSSIGDRGGRSRSPFNVSQTQNTSITKEPVRVRQEIVEDYNEKNRNPYLYESQPKPISKYFEERNDIVRKPEIETYYEEDYYAQKETKKETIRRVAPKISVENLESFDNRQSREEINNRPVPRDRPLGSPSRAPKAKDSTAELNTLSRFLSNTIVIKTIEDLVFQLVPEFLDEAKNPKTETVVKKQNMKGSKREPSFEFEAKDNQSRKEVIKEHNKEFLNIVAEMDRQDEANVYDSDDVDEHSHVNRIIESKEKHEMINPYVTSRDIDTLGIKFETNKMYKGMKSVAYHEKGNFIMTDVKSKLSRQVHEVGDVWWTDCFDLIKEEEQEIHHKAWRPFFTSKELIEEKGEFQVNDLPYVNEKIFKVSKAITQHLSDVLKTNAGIFDETVEIRFLRILRQKSEDIEKNNRNIKAITQMNDAITQVLDDSRGNSDLYWVFVFSKRLSKLTDDKMDLIEKINKEKELQEECQNKVRETFIDKTSLRLTTIKDKMSQSINFDDVKSVLMAPYTKESKNDSRFVDLRIKGKNKA